MKRRITLILSGAILLSSLPVNMVQANELEEIEVKEQQIEDNQNVIQNQLAAIENLEGDINLAFEEIERLSAEREELQKEIADLEAEIEELDKSIAEKEEEQDRLQKKLDEKVQVFKKRIDVMYKNRNVGTINVLLEAENAEDFLTRLNSMKAVAGYDREVIAEMNDIQKELDMLILSLKGTRASRDQAYENLKYKEARVLDSINDQNTVLAVLQSNRDLAQEEVTRLNGLVDSLNAEIEELNIQYQERLKREEEERQRRIAEEKARIEAERKAAEEEARRAEEERLAQEAEAESQVSGEVEELEPVEVVEEAEPVDTYSYVEAPVEASYIPFDGNVVYFNQRETPWGSYPYGTGRYSSIAANGCGPTSMAMVISSLTDQYVTPSDMADFATANGHVMPGDGGSAWSLFPAAASTYGLSCKQSYDRNEINQALSNGALVIMSQNNALGGYWTLGGHFIVLTGIDENGYISVADPWSRAKSVISHSQEQVYVPMKTGFIIYGQ